MKKISLLVLLISLGFHIPAQEYEQLIITKIRHSVLVNESINLNNKSFPCYFSDSLFRADIADTLLKYAGRNYSIDTVIFGEKDFVQCMERAFPVKVKPLVPPNANANDLYMSLSTQISFSSFEYQEVFYKLSTSVHIVNSRNKTVLKTKTEIPFVIRLSEGIIVDTLMHKNDFEIFYLDLLTSVLNGTRGTLGKRFIYRPVTRIYNDFLYSASDYIIQRGIRDLSLEKDDGEDLKILDFEQIELSSEELSDLFTEHKTVEKFLLRPVSGNEEFEVTISCRTGSANSQGQAKKVEIEVCGNSNPFNFLLDESANMSGVWSKDTLSIHWKESNAVSEININGELAGLIHYKDDGQHFYYRHDLHPKKLVKLSLLIFLYNEALAVLQNSRTPSDYYLLKEEFLKYLLYY